MIKRINKHSSQHLPNYYIQNRSLVTLKEKFDKMKDVEITKMGIQNHSSIIGYHPQKKTKSGHIFLT